MARKTLPAPKNFEDALTELDRIVTEMERGEVTLDDSLSRYERGNQLIVFCRQTLTSAQRQMEVVAKGSAPAAGVSDTIQASITASAPESSTAAAGDAEARQEQTSTPRATDAANGPDDDAI